MVSVEYSEAIVEVLEILQYSDNNIIEKIPKSLIEFWEKNKSTTYKPNLDHSKPINKMNLKKKTKSIITMLYLNYLCDDEEKIKTKLILRENEEKYQQELRQKYNPDNIFKKKKEEVSKNIFKEPKEEVSENIFKKQKQEEPENVVTTNVAMREYKEPIFKKIINMIKRFFHVN